MIKILLIAMTLGSSLPTLKYRALDSNGDPLSGAKLHFYETGTTTPLATYSDEGLTSANANPVVADSYGWFGEIYMQTDHAYRVKLATSADVVQWTLDDVHAAQLSSDAFQTRLKQAASNPLDYGAVGDGVADETSYVQSAIDNATGVVDLLGKTYRCDNSISIDTADNDLTIKNGTLDFSSSAEDSYIIIEGSIGSNDNLASDATVGDLSLEVTSGSGLGSGDWLGLWSSGLWAVSFYIGEIVQIYSIGGTTVTLWDPINGSYATVDTAKVAEITPVERVRFEDVTVIANPSAGGDGDAVSASYVEDLSLSRCSFVGFKRYAISAHAAIGLVVDRCTFDESGANGVALHAFGFNRGVSFTNNKVSRTTDGVSIGDDTSAVGQSRWVRIESNTIDASGNALISGRSTQYVTVKDNDVTGGTNGIYIRGIDTKATGNSVRDSTTGINVTQAVTFDSGEGRTTLVSGNRIKDLSAKGIYTATSTLGAELIIADNTVQGVTIGIHNQMDHAKIRGNTIHGHSSFGIELGETLAGVEYVTVSGNHIHDAPDGVDMIQVHASETVISGNLLESDSSSGMNAIDLTGGERNINVTDNMITGNVTNVNGVNIETGLVVVSVNSNTFSKVASAVVLNGCQDVTIDGNKVSTTGASVGVEINGASNHRVTITGNVFEVGSSGYGIKQESSSGLHYSSIAGNTFRVGTSGYGIHQTSSSMSLTSIVGNQFVPLTSSNSHIYFVNADFITISGNVFSSSSGTQSNISLNGSAPSVVDSIIISGNVFDEGTYAVDEATDANNVNITVGPNTLEGITYSGVGGCQGTCAMANVTMEQTNTACNTTCTGVGACIYGYDIGVPAAVDCTDATADYCICIP